MQLVIADTGPINYLILIDQIDILPALFERVILPTVVRDELNHPKAPPAVRNWIGSPPTWVEIRQTVDVHDAATVEFPPPYIQHVRHTKLLASPPG